MNAQQDAVMRQAGAVVREQEERLASMPVGVDTTRASRGVKRPESMRWPMAIVIAVIGAMPPFAYPWRLGRMVLGSCRIERR